MMELAKNASLFQFNYLLKLTKLQRHTYKAFLPTSLKVFNKILFAKQNVSRRKPQFSGSNYHENFSFKYLLPNIKTRIHSPKFYCRCVHQTQPFSLKRVESFMMMTRINI